MRVFWVHEEHVCCVVYHALTILACRTHSFYHSAVVWIIHDVIRQLCALDLVYQRLRCRVTLLSRVPVKLN
jgi:hypothetical protein